MYQKKSRLKLNFIILKKILIFFLFISVLFSSCKVYFTQKIYNQIIEQNLDITGIQFYNSDKIILQRIDTIVSNSENSSKLTTREDIILEKIIIKKNRPAICDSIIDKGLSLRFEKGDSNFLVFVVKDTLLPDSKFVIGAQSWENDLGLTPYGDKEYYIQTESIDASLKIKKRFIENFLVNKRKLKGLKIDQNG